jgi:phosphoribosyl-AMP cyclohydrolase / phosphoribosyl-ATP pyrophosphohydrolase
MNFEKQNGLVPAVIQHNNTMEVLMVGFMNEEAYQKTLEEGKVTFFSRTKNRLWTKGETSGNFLKVCEIIEDCDEDTLLIKVLPDGPVCHTGTSTCFGESSAKGFLYELEDVINKRITSENSESYTRSLFQKGINKIAQKVGEEAVELVIEAKDENEYLFKEEAADLLFHYLILLRAKNVSLNDIEDVLKNRNKKS